MWGAETFELVYPEKKFRLLSEHVRTPSIHACALANKCFSNSSFKAEAGMQVTRTPPVCVIHAEGQRWRFDAENEPHVWFWGASIDLNVRRRRPRRMVPCMPASKPTRGARARAQMNFVLRVTFEDGDQFTYTKVTGARLLVVRGRAVRCSALHSTRPRASR